ncbi:uncharacterized protein VTP21DRAFT_10369 [Calcarisporiella thermophila]|uniref:uncharacterized protein n=1 Tax=Calcarisporiella thermophila TaxID=911321 RepID=UPI00374222D5
MFIKRVLNCLLVATLAASAIAGPADEDLAPLVAPEGQAKVIDGSYIVVYKPGAEESSQLKSQAIRDGVKHVFEIEDFKGFAGQFDAETLKKIRADPTVAYVERDAVVSLDADEVPEPEAAEPEQVEADTTKKKKNRTQKGSPWGLARVSHRKKLDDKTKDKYVYNPDGGKGVTAYVLDTGILTTHPEFEGRARWGATFADDGDKDLHGHGTHVAGTIGSKTYGVAKKVQLVAVKVLNGNGTGSTSKIVAAIDWVVKDAKGTSADTNNKKRAVANMSLSGGNSDALDNAVNKAVEAGVHFAVSAGNKNADSCLLSPPRAEKAIVTAASDVNDKKADFSSFGKCVDIIAPGVDVLSTWNDGKTKSISGTSMAAPHVTGLLAQFLSEKNRNHAEMVKYLQKAGLKNAITGFDKDTVNLLAYNNLGA